MRARQVISELLRSVGCSKIVMAMVTLIFVGLWLFASSQATIRPRSSPKDEIWHVAHQNRSLWISRAAHDFVCQTAIFHVRYVSLRQFWCGKSSGAPRLDFGEVDFGRPSVASGRLPLWSHRPCHSEPKSVELNLAVTLEPDGRANEFCLVVPGSASNDPIGWIAALKLGRAIGRHSLVTVVPNVLDPFPDVPLHVV